MERNLMPKLAFVATLFVSIVALSASSLFASSRAQANDTYPYRLFVPMVAADSAPPVTTTVVPYFFLDSTPGDEGGPFLVPVHREVPQTSAVATAAVQQLLAGPTAGELASVPAISSAVPPGTELLGLTISGGVATVNLSEEFESGGGSFSVRGRLAQLVFTLTRFSTVDSVVLQIEGETVTNFSSEGIIIDGPLTREDFLDPIEADLVPSILLETPVYGGEAGNPLRLTGIANVFEANFMVTLVDNDGLILYESHVTASCGTGCWGTFDVTIPYSVDERQLGAVIVWVASAQDGSMVNIREYPVWLEP
jgi:germination protein M